MKKFFLLGVLITAFLIGVVATPECSAKMKKLDIQEPFEGYVLLEGLENPWDITYGPDKMLWVTERMGKRITRINPDNGNKKVAVTIDDAFAAGGHQGVLGMAMAPDFMKSGSNNYLYVLYTYKPAFGGPENGYKKLVRYQYDVKEEVLKNPATVLDRLPAGNDHNGGRVVFGPDGMLYISFGELGHNQFGNYRLPIEAQRLPTALEVSSQDWQAYVGKILRISPDGSIPMDNPLLEGVKSHVYTYGHRNPQGLTFAGNNLFSCEHGPSSDDELNLLVAGSNYGWPHVAGFQDNEAYRYANWSLAPNDPSIKWDANVIDGRVPVQNETDWIAPANYKNPLKTFFTVATGYNYHDADAYGDLAYAMWPTVGPSSVMYYPKNAPIEGWDNSIIMTTLKNGAIYRIKLASDMKNVQGDVAKFFHTPNRYRDICASPDNKTFYVITDSEGTAVGYDMKPTDKIQNPGAVLIFKYAAKSSR